MNGIQNYSEPVYGIRDQDEDIIGKSQIMKELFLDINRLVHLPTTVLIRGETGTGKELVAKALHYNNGTSEVRPFITVNCAGIPESLMESLLFGYKRGAFTDAHSDKKGFVEVAQGGTLFLDEIAEMTPFLQSKILRLLQNKEVTPVGSTKSIKVDTRIITATNRNLEEEITEERFREDLYYRINVFPLHIPALRERQEDIPLITRNLIQKFNVEYDANLEGILEEANQKLISHNWPGNIRELENVVERVFVRKQKGKIEASDIDLGISLDISIKSEPQTDSNLIEPWYSKGVLPVSRAYIRSIEGTVGTKKLSRLSRSSGVYSDFSGTLIWLTPDNMDDFFQDNSTECYDKLLQEIKDNEFNEIIKQPFKIYDRIALHNNPNMFDNEITINKILEEEEIQLVQREKGARKFIVLNMHNAQYLVPSGFNQQYKINRLEKEIRDYYEKFKEWKPE